MPRRRRGAPAGGGGGGQRAPARHQPTDDPLVAASIPLFSLRLHNLDFAGFGVLLRAIHTHSTQKTSLDLSLPFEIFQHAMVELLNAYLLQLGAQVAADDGDGNAYCHDALRQICATHYCIPRPLHQYIMSIAGVLADCGQVDVHVPLAGVPLGPLAAPADEHGNETAAPAGTFGPPTAATHNSYECYWSPFVSQQLIRRTIEAYDAADGSRDAPMAAQDWNPFPANWTPAGSVLNEHLLGYRKLFAEDGQQQRYLRGAVEMMRQCRFAGSSNTLLGRLCHSRECLEMTSNWARRQGADAGIPAVVANFDEHLQRPERVQSGLQFVISESNAAEKNVPNWERLFSPFNFTQTEGGLACCYGLKRHRLEAEPGVMLSLAVDGSVPADWVATRNANLEMTGVFRPKWVTSDNAGRLLGEHGEGYASLRQEHFQAKGNYIRERLENLVKNSPTLIRIDIV